MSELKLKLDKDIFIIGESNHNLVYETSKQLIQKFIGQDAYIFSEGITESSQTSDLDDFLAGFRTEILLASLYTKSLEYMPDKQFFQRVRIKKANMVVSILEHSKAPKIDELKEKWLKIKNKTSDVSNIIGLLLPSIEEFRFNFLDIYEYYFGKDTYYPQMEILLSLNNQDAFNVMQFGPKDKTYGEICLDILQEAREMAMVKRVMVYMKKPNRRKVIIFTGLSHMNKLEKELSKDFTVKTMILKKNTLGII